MSWTLSALGLFLLAPASPPGGGDEKKTVPVYTNADLERLAPRRGETGVLSEVAALPPPAAAPDGEDESARRARSEAYWRRQADRHRERMRQARQRMEDLRARIAEREASPRRRRGGPDPQVEALARQLTLLEERVREAEGRFADRARQAGALPGWLR